MTDPGWVLDSLVNLINSPPWKCLVDNFIDENCLVFDNQDLSQFAYTEVHERYQKLVEGQLEMLMGFLGISAEQFLAAMAKATAPNSEHKIQAAEDYVVFKKMMEKRNLELNQQAMVVLQQRSPPPVTKDTMTSATESKEKEAEEEELQEALRRSKEEFEEGMSRGLSVEEREMEEEELQQALKRSMEEYTHITTAQQQPIPALSNQETEPPESRQAPTEPASPPAGSRSQPPPASPSFNSSAKHLVDAHGLNSQPQTPGPTSSSQPPPADTPGLRVAPTVSAPPAVRTGADAAAEWLASARAEATKTSTSSLPTSQSLKEINIKQRQAYLRKQRDELVARNQRQRKKDLDTYTASVSNTPTTTAAASPTHQSQQSANQQPVLCSALSNKLQTK